MKTKIKVYDKNCYGVLTKGNGDCYLTPELHPTLCTEGGQAGQGYPCALIRKKKIVKPRYKFYYWHSHALQSYEIHNICPTIPAALGMGGASMTSPILIVQEIPKRKNNDRENEK